MKKNTEEKMVQKRRVVITGLGAVTPIGNTVPEFWTNVRKGTVGIGEITGFDTKDFKVKLAAQVKDFHGEEKMDAKAEKAAGQLGIAELLKKYPYEVSGGQKQRTAIARALITNPRILLADEPTGALDSKAATNLLKQLREINQTGQTILMVTHSNVAASYADRVMFIKDGEVFHQIYRGDMTRSAMLDKICDAVTVLMRGGEDSES